MLKDMKDQQINEESDSPWVSPVMLARKNWKLPLCGLSKVAWLYQELLPIIKDRWHPTYTYQGPCGDQSLNWRVASCKLSRAQAARTQQSPLVRGCSRLQFRSLATATLQECLNGWWNLSFTAYAMLCLWNIPHESGRYSHC
jgi:hypothetical protein